MKKYINKGFYLTVFLLLLTCSLQAQEVEDELQTRTSFTASTKLFKDFKISISPELRFDEDFSLDKYLVETELSYKLFKSFSLGAGYRLYADLKDSKSTEYNNRFSLSAKYEGSFYQFDPSFKIMYTNFSDDQEDSKLFRYKAAVKYNIDKCRFTPYAGIEAFQQTENGELHKMRYLIGTDFKLFKKNHIDLSYKLDYYQNELKNKHIISIGYKLKF